MRRGSKWLHLPALAGVIGLVLGLAPQRSSAREPSPKSGRAIVESNPEAFGPIIDRIHFTVADVPAFPMEDRRFANPSTWPETMTIDGKKVVRKIYAWSGYIGSELTSLKQRKSGMRLVLSYGRADSDEDDDYTWGPRYSWNDHGQITERMYFEPRGKLLVTHDYTYSRDGKLLGYSWRSDARDPEHHAKDSEYLSEFYDADGQLIAVAYEKKREGETVSLYSWSGEIVPFDEFRMKSHILYAKYARSAGRS
jgi:hypothetical protein